MSNAQSRIAATSEAQRGAWGRGLVAEAEEVRPGLWAVALPMPGARMPSSFGYAFLGEEGVHIVDPGWRAEETVAHWERFLAARGRAVSEIRTLLITHSHPDHLGAAERLIERSGARLVMSAAEASVLGSGVHVGSDPEQQAARLARWGVPAALRDELAAMSETERPSEPIAADRLLADGERIRLGGRELTAHASPGHTGGHVCFELECDGVILTGDHVLPQISPGIGLGALPGSSPLLDYLGSLRAMVRFDAHEVLPGHEFRFRGLAARSEQIAAHHLRRTRAVAALVPELGDAPVWEYAARSPWSRGWDAMSGFLLISGLVQTELHLDAVRSGGAEEWMRGEWASAQPTHA